MGKAADRRKAARARYLAKLADSAPEKFQEEWRKRMDSWAGEAWKRAGQLGGPSVFEVLNEAQQALAGCQHAGVTPDAVQSLSTLAHECTRALAVNVDRRLYQVTQQLKKKP
jgi:hypothetical protein